MEGLLSKVKILNLMCFFSEMFETRVDKRRLEGQRIRMMSPESSQTIKETTHFVLLSYRKQIHYGAEEKEI